MLAHTRRSDLAHTRRSDMLAHAQVFALMRAAMKSAGVLSSTDSWEGDLPELPADCAEAQGGKEVEEGEEGEGRKVEEGRERGQRREGVGGAASLAHITRDAADYVVLAFGASACACARLSASLSGTHPRCFVRVHCRPT